MPDQKNKEEIEKVVREINEKEYGLKPVSPRQDGSDLSNDKVGDELDGIK